MLKLIRHRLTDVSQTRMSIQHRLTDVSQIPSKAKSPLTSKFSGSLRSRGTMSAS